MLNGSGKSGYIIHMWQMLHKFMKRRLSPETMYRVQPQWQMQNNTKLVNFFKKEYLPRKNKYNDNMA